MKTLKYSIFCVLLAMAYNLHAAKSSGNLSRGPGGPQLQGGTMCIHTSPEAGPEIYYAAAGVMRDLSYCQAQHTNLIASGGHRDDKNGNPEDCVISVEAFD